RGPTGSTDVPEVVYERLVSLLAVGATVMAAPTRAGDVGQASVLLLPAARQSDTPALIAPLTESSRACDAPPPRDMLATAGRMRFCATQLTPAMTPELAPDPLQLRTPTATSPTPFATPYVPPPTAPVTCGPGPLHAWTLRPC